MAVSDNQPTNLNYLSQLGFRFAIKKLPNVNYFCQSVSLPSISIGAAEFNTPFGVVPRPGDKIAYSTLPIRFKVDEDFRNYIEIHDWMIGLGHPDSLEDTRRLSETAPGPIRKVGTASSLVSDGTLIIQTSHKNPSISVSFYDLFPLDLSELTFDASNDDVLYLEATATFRYRRYTITRI